MSFVSMARSRSRTRSSESAMSPLVAGALRSSIVASNHTSWHETASRVVLARPSCREEEQVSAPTARKCSVVGQLGKLMPLVFPLSAMLRKLWGRPPGLRGTPSSRIWNKWGQRLAGCEQADGGVGRGPGGPPHDLCRRPAPEKRVALAWQAARDPEGTRVYRRNWRVANPPD